MWWSSNVSLVDYASNLSSPVGAITMNTVWGRVRDELLLPMTARLLGGSIAALIMEEARDYRKDTTLTIHSQRELTELLFGRKSNKVTPICKTFFSWNGVYWGDTALTEHPIASECVVNTISCKAKSYTTCAYKNNFIWEIPRSISLFNYIERDFYHWVWSTSNVEQT